MQPNVIILFAAPTASDAGRARGSSVEEGQADIVVLHDGTIIKDRYGNAAAVLDKLGKVAS